MDKSWEPICTACSNRHRPARPCWAGLAWTRPPTFDYRALRDAAIDRLADAVEEHLDGKRLLELLGRTA